MNPKAQLCLALFILMVGWGSAVMVGWRTVKFGTGLILVKAPGTLMVQLPHPGPYTVYDEYQGILDRQYYFREGAVKGLTLRITDPATSRPLVLSTGDPANGYRFGARRSMEVAKFEAPAAGQYQLASAFSQRTSVTQTMLGIGDGRERSVTSRLLLMWGLTLGTTLLAGAIALHAVVRRNQ